MITNKFTPEYAKTLKSLHESGQSDELIAHVKALRVEGWPLSVVSEAVGVSKTSISKWSHKDTEFIPVEVPEYSRPHELTQFEITNLRLLTEKASKVRRFTDPQSPARIAALALEKSLISHKENGVTISDLARACGVTRRAINQRLEKYDAV